MHIMFFAPFLALPHEILPRGGTLTREEVIHLRNSFVLACEEEQVIFFHYGVERGE